MTDPLCKYRFRPGYGSPEYLLELNFQDDKQDTIAVILKALEILEPRITDITDLWQNDEVLLHITSNAGGFTISKDIWGFIFIMAEGNQPALKSIDDIFSKDPVFIKEQVDPDEYTISGSL